MDIGTTSADAPVVRVCVLGPVTVDIGAGATEVTARQQRRLLCLLAAAALEGRAVPATELLDELYDSREARSTRSAAATALWRLRSAIGADLVTGGVSGYSLDLGSCEIDIVEFENLVNGGHASLMRGEPVQADKQLSRALAMWGSSELADITSIRSGAAVAIRLKEMRLGAVEDRAAALTATGRGGEAVALLTGLAESHTSREHAWALLAEAHVAESHLSEARRVLDVAARHLAEQGLEPGTELAEARRRIGAVPSGDRAAHPAGRSPVEPPDPARAPAAAGRIVGRDREARFLLDAARRSLATTGCQLLLVEGEAGIGKTAMLETVAATLGADGAHVGWSFGDDRMGLPYAALQPWMTQMHGCAPDEEVTRFLFGGAPGGGDAEPSYRDPESLREAIVASLVEAASRRGPTVLFLDDAHLATGPLLETLSVLTRHPRPVPLCVIAAVRDPYRAQSEVSPALRAFRRSASARVALGGLTVDAVAEILGGAGFDGSLAGWLHEVTGGNALFVTQLAQLDLDGMRFSLGSSLPRAIEDAIDSRIEALPQEVAAVLGVAAVIGAEVDERILAAAATDVFALDFLTVTESVEQAVEARLLAPTSTAGHGCYRWVHSLVAERLYHANGAASRARTHAAVGRAIERLALAAAPEPSVLAHHYSLAWPACPVETAVEHLRSAGQRSAADLDFARAGDFFARALDLLSLDPRRDELADLVCELLGLSAQAANFAGDRSRARETYSRMATLGGAGWKLRASLGAVSTYADERIDLGALYALEVALASAVAEYPGPGPSAPDRKLIADGLASLSLYRPSAAYDLIAGLSRWPELEAPALMRVWELQPVARQVEIAARLTAHQQADPHRARLRHVISRVAAGHGSLHSPVGPASPPAHPTPPAAGQHRPPSSAEANIEMRLWRIAVATAAGEFEYAWHLIAKTRTRLHAIPDLARSTAYLANLRGQANWLEFLGAEPENLREIRWSEPRHSVWHHAGEQISAFISARQGLTGQSLAMCERIVGDLLDGALPEGNSLARVATLASACRASGYRRGMEVCLEHLEPHAGEHVVFFISIYWGSVNQRLGGLHLGLGHLDAARERFQLAVEEHDRVGARVMALWSRCDLAEVLWRLGGTHRQEGERLWDEAAAQAVKLGARAPTLRRWPPDPLP